jgi:hypothetical protein
MTKCKEILRTEPDRVLHQYEQICASHRAIDDFRGKLLALWPILGGAAGSIALLVAEDIAKGHLLAVGLVGLLVSIGLGVYEWNQSLRCVQLTKCARKLEECMEFEPGTGQFRSLPTAFATRFTAPTSDEELQTLIENEKVEITFKSVVDHPVRMGLASGIVYGTVILGWSALFIWATAAAIVDLVS